MKALAFLASDFGFRLLTPTTRSHECLVEYRTQTVSVVVSYEWNSEIWVTLAPLSPESKELALTDRIGLDFLIAVRCPHLAVNKDLSRDHWTDQDVQRVLSGYAVALNECGRELLAGDFSNMADVREYAEKCRIRREQALYSASIESDPVDR